MPGSAPRNLLEDLAAAAGCDYLSDLHLSSHLPAVRRAVSSISAARYPLCQWQEALAYLCGIHTRFSTERGARAQLLAGLDSLLDRC